MNKQLFSNEQLMGFLHEIPDPEIPVIDIVELGVIREINAQNDSIEVTITPTYSGCPAMKQMEDDIKKKLSEKGYKEVKIKTIFNPPWTTDWITEEAKDKLIKHKEKIVQDMKKNSEVKQKKFVEEMKNMRTDDIPVFIFMTDGENLEGSMDNALDMLRK
jgi:phenylacetate-CoA oxygenase PaaJ subunit